MKKLFLVISINLIFMPLFCNGSIGDINFRFRKLSPEGGFSHEALLSIAIDNDGYIWFNTISSVYQYNGYEFHIFLINKSNAPFIINTVYHDRNNNIWVTTGQGVYKLNKLKSIFEKHSSFSDNVLKIEEDIYGNCWILRKGQVEIYDRTNGVFHTTEINSLFKSKNQNIFIVGANVFFTIFDGSTKIYKYDNKYRKWVFFVQLPITSEIVSLKIKNNFLYFITSYQGLFEYNTTSKSLIKHGFLGDRQAENNNMARMLFVDSKQNLWVGTQRGLYIYNPETRKYLKFINKLDSKFGLPNNSIQCMTEDKWGGLWFGNYSGGFAYCNPLFDQPFITIRQKNENYSNANFISTIAEGENNCLWLGSEGGGIIKYDRKTDVFSNFRHSNSYHSISNDNIKSLLVDSKKNIWVAMFNGGIDLFSMKNSTNSIIPNNIIPNQRFFCIAFEGDSILWLAGKGDLIRYNLKYKTLQSIKIPNSKPEIVVFTVYHILLYNGYVWIVSTDGLFKMKLGSQTIDRVHFKSKDAISDYLSFFTALPDKNNNLWLGSANSGLLKFNIKTDSIAKIKQIKADYIYSILIDNRETLWLGTNIGLFSYNCKVNEVRSFTEEDGIQSNLFYPNSALNLKSGELAFGGTNGLTIFDPKKITKNLIPPKTLINSFLINDKPYIGNLSEKIKLTFKDKVIRINFTAISYLMPSKNKFSYKLVGKDDNWIDCDADTRSVTYSDLPSGNYTFQLKSANNDGIWNNNIAKVRFRVLPAPWNSFWAYLIYAVIIGIVLWLLRRYYKEKGEYLENLRLIQFEKEKTEQISIMKVNFFTNVSHEFKTPLTLIVTPLKKLIPTLSDENPDKKTLNYVYKNAMRLQQLINELMEFRTLENKKSGITYQNKEIYGYIRQLGDLFVDMASECNINYFIDIPNEELILPMDYSKMEKIVSNLMSNAIKNTNSNGIIIMSLVWKPEPSVDFLGNIILKISNTSNIKLPSNISILFENYFKQDTQSNINQKGSGIGLAYTRELVELLGGKIKVTNDNNEVSFQVTLPIVSQMINTTTSQEHLVHFNYVQEQIELLDNEMRIITNKNDNLKLTTLLIVEDNTELLQYLCDTLVTEYCIISAQNGKDAFDLAKEKNPALIITDVMMPVMSGFELCKILKDETITSHIPIIMLSAATNNENKVEGLQSGADVFIEKPFDMDFLSLQIKNLLKSREEMRKTFSKRIEPQPFNVEQPSKDDIFLNKAIEIVSKNISNTDFNVDAFAKEMGHSRTVCYSKIKALSDLSINEFILTLRLKTAAKLLKENALTVNEISFQVGFNDPNYFNTCFKRYYNIPPKMYAKNNS